ncbi:MAG: zinc metallopeptidase [Planctomycetia bacterium]|nr:zinc metallopeptidase [Planctomycetia bacterium]
MFFIDPLYLLFVALPAAAIAGIAAYRVKAAFAKYSQEGTARGFTGAEAAAKLLDYAGIKDVRVVPAEGFGLSDHYNPRTKELALSSEVFHSRSVAAIGVAAHETGHAVQHAKGYAPLWIRSALVPTAHIGSTFGVILMAFGAFMTRAKDAGPVGTWVLLAGVGLFSCVLLFQLVTLPVELDATARAKRMVVEAGVVYPEERPGMDKVLSAAAWTYVAAVLTSVLIVLYYLWRSGLLGGRRSN